MPFFIPIVKEYGKLINPAQKLQRYPEDFPTIAKAKFTPSITDTVAQAYENFLWTRQSRRYRNYQDILSKWHECLENLIFQDSSWCDSNKNYLKTTWKQALFRKPYPRQRALQGRHPSGQVISLNEAFQFIHYFCKEFVSAPHQIRNGEIASLLCLMICLTHGNFNLPFTQSNLFSLLVKDIQIQHQLLKVKNIKFHASKIIIEIFSILTKNKNLDDRVFPHISLDWAEDAFKVASRELYPGWADHVLPGAFNHFPHPFPGEKIPASIWFAMTHEDILNIQPGNRVWAFLKRFKLPTQCFLNIN